MWINVYLLTASLCGLVNIVGHVMNALGSTLLVRSITWCLSSGRNDKKLVGTNSKYKITYSKRLICVTWVRLPPPPQHNINWRG
jgi:hypothetical protein